LEEEEGKVGEWSERVHVSFIVWMPLNNPLFPLMPNNDKELINMSSKPDTPEKKACRVILRNGDDQGQ
jgi:hypothetical protein